MKKTLFIAALLVAGVASAFATEYTAKAYITMGTNTLKLREAAELSTTAYDNGADVSAYNKTGVVAYATLTGNTSTDKWIQFGGDDLEGVVVAFKAKTAGEQTLTFSDVEGAQLYLVDAVTGELIAIKNDGSYTFTAEAADVADWNTTRFSITKVAPLADYTFINNTLVIGEVPTGTTVTVTPFTYGVGGKNFGTPVEYSAPVNQVLNGGYFLVTYPIAEGTREFIVNANPDVVPANP